MVEKALFPKGRDYYDDWEVLDERQKAVLIKERLADYLRFAESQSPFYQGRLKADLDSEFPLAHVPVLRSSDLRKELPVQGDRLLTDKSGYYTVFQSGGTTGFPKTSLFSHEEVLGLNLPNARGFFAVGLTPADRVANLFAVGGLYMTLIHINQMLMNYGCMNFPFSNHTATDFIDTVTRHFRINCFTGITSVVLGTLREIIRNGVDGLEINKIYYGGEHIYQADRNEMRSSLGVEKIFAPGYGTVDSWYIGYQCERCLPGIFHAHDDQAYIEILGATDEEVLGPGGVGMLHVTAFPRRLTPIIRYQVGDRAKWLEERCPCGRTTPLFQLLGRGDDVLRIGYDSIDYNAVQNLVVQVPGLTGMMQMQKSRTHGKDLLMIRIETDLPDQSYDEARVKLLQLLLNDRPSLREFVEKGMILPVQIEIVALGTLPLNARTGKLIRVIDAL